MENINDIRHHIKAVDQTKALTNAMEIVSSNRMRQVMKHIEYNQMYFERVQETMKDILMSASEIHNKYIDHRHINHCTYIVIAGDKGMAGAHNANVLKFALNTIRTRAEPEYSLITIGETAYEFFTRNGIEPDQHLYGIAQDPTEKRARKLADDFVNIYDSGKTDAMKLIYTSFYGETKNKPVVKRILPIRITDFGNIPYSKAVSEYEYSPSAQTVFNQLVPQYVVCIVFALLVQSYASEHYERMMAMQSATKNADSMLQDYQRAYNMARQSGITNEIAEITSSAEILKENNE